MNQAKLVFNVKELSEYLQISSSSVRKLVRENSIPYFRILSKILFSKESVDLWIKNQELNNINHYLSTPLNGRGESYV